MTVSHMTTGHKKGEGNMPKQTFFNLDKIKQEKILEVAMEEFAFNSFEKVTIDNIVKKSGIPKGSFYQYFLNKEDIYKYLFKLVGSEKSKDLEKYLPKLKELSFSEFIRELYLAGIDFDFQDSTYVGLREKFLYNCSMELREEILELMIIESNALLEKILKHYMTKGELKKNLKIDLVADMLTTLTIFFSKRLKTKERKSKEYVIEVMEEMISIIEEGIKRS